MIEKQRSKQGAHDMERWNMCMLHLHVMCIAVCCMLVACACACACMCITCACACCMYVHACCACMHVARACMCMCLGHRHSCWGRDLTPRHRVAAEERYSVPNGVWGGRVAATGSCVRSARARRTRALSAASLEARSPSPGNECCVWPCHYSRCTSTTRLAASFTRECASCRSLLKRRPPSDLMPAPCIGAGLWEQRGSYGL